MISWGGGGTEDVRDDGGEEQRGGRVREKKSEGGMAEGKIANGRQTEGL